ncbi:MAG: peroxiredoxin Q/BCP [Pseudohongiellaceae bacterium]
MKIFGVSYDTIEANRAFTEKHNFGFPLLCDTERSLALAYLAADDKAARAPRRVTYIIDAEGKIEYAQAVSLFGIKAHVSASIARLKEEDT